MPPLRGIHTSPAALALVMPVDLGPALPGWALQAKLQSLTPSEATIEFTSTELARHYVFVLRVGPVSNVGPASNVCPRLARFFVLFHQESGRDPVRYGSAKAMTDDQTKAALLLGARGVGSMLTEIGHKMGSPMLLPYANQRRAHFEKQTNGPMTYHDYLQLQTCHGIVHSHLSSAPPNTVPPIAANLPA